MLTFIIAEGPAKFYREFDGKPQKFNISAERHSKKMRRKSQLHVDFTKEIQYNKTKQGFLFQKKPQFNLLFF